MAETPESAQAKRVILRVLKNCDGYLLAQSTLIEELRQAIAPRPSLSQLRDWIEQLEQAGCVTSIRPALGAELKWSITDQGKALLQNS